MLLWVPASWIHLDVVDVNVIRGAGMHSLVSCFAVNNSNLAVVLGFIQML